VKHSYARRATVSARCGDGVAEIEVRDDGAGFDPEAPGAGRGPLGMRERVAMRGGTLEIDSRPGVGTRVAATLPHARGVRDGRGEAGARGEGRARDPALSDAVRAGCDRIREGRVRGGGEGACPVRVSGEIRGEGVGNVTFLQGIRHVRHGSPRSVRCLYGYGEQRANGGPGRAGIPREGARPGDVPGISLKEARRSSRP